MALRCQGPLVPILDLRVAQPAAPFRSQHYFTPAHRAWSREVIARAGYICQDPDCQTPKRGRGKRLYADHVKELKDGGAPLDLANGMARCAQCHGRKTYAAKLRREGKLP